MPADPQFNHIFTISGPSQTLSDVSVLT